MRGTVGGSKGCSWRFLVSLNGRNSWRFQGVQLEVFGEAQWEEQLEVPRGAVGGLWWASTGGTVGGSKGCSWRFLVRLNGRNSWRFQGVQLEVFGEPQWEEQLEVPRGAVGGFWWASMGGTVGGSKGLQLEGFWWASMTMPVKRVHLEVPRVQLEGFRELQGSAVGGFWWSWNLLDFETQVFRYTTDYCYRYVNMS